MLRSSGVEETAPPKWCVAGGVDAGRAMKGIDFEAGVVGDDDCAGRMAGVIDGLQTGVSLEGGLVFERRGDLVETGERKD